MIWITGHCHHRGLLSPGARVLPRLPPYSPPCHSRLISSFDRYLCSDHHQRFHLRFSAENFSSQLLLTGKPISILEYQDSSTISRASDWYYANVLLLALLLPPLSTADHHQLCRLLSATTATISITESIDCFAVMSSTNSTFSQHCLTADHQDPLPSTLSPSELLSSPIQAVAAHCPQCRHR